MCAVPRRELGTMEHSTHSSAARIAFSRTRRWWRYRTLAAVAKGTRRRRKKIRATSAAAVKGRRRRKTRIREASHSSDAHTPLPSPPRANPVAWRWASPRAHRSDSVLVLLLAFASPSTSALVGSAQCRRFAVIAQLTVFQDPIGMGSQALRPVRTVLGSIGAKPTVCCARQPGSFCFRYVTLQRNIVERHDEGAARHPPAPLRLAPWTLSSPAT